MPSIGIHNEKLQVCPDTPNCVCSDAEDTLHRVEPFALELSADQAWPLVCELIGQLPRTRIITSTDHYLHAEVRTAFFRFVDDLELHLRPRQQLIAVRSASRLGRSDLGVNRKRIEHLRKHLKMRGVIR
ncbi:DUF1499 domain-containing protein [bacterium]|nr:DUF1499 domain-containing protein [candidate division CSSED10-310 bacterium]